MGIGFKKKQKKNWTFYEASNLYCCFSKKKFQKIQHVKKKKALVYANVVKT